MGNREKEKRAGQSEDGVWFIFADEILRLRDPTHPKQRATKNGAALRSGCQFECGRENMDSSVDRRVERMITRWRGAR
jgi:hypothetical protein